MPQTEFGKRGATVEDGGVWNAGEHADLWISCHGYESRSVQHLQLPPLNVDRRLSIGFGFPLPADEEKGLGSEQLAAFETRAQLLTSAGFEIRTLSDVEFDSLLRTKIAELGSGRDRFRVVADISSMNRARIASLVLACASRDVSADCELELVYFPSTFATHKHQYEPLEAFGPVHERVAGWPIEPDLPLALVLGVGTEPRRADGVVETLEPRILSLFLPRGDDPDYEQELAAENRRVLEVAGEPTEYFVRQPSTTYELLRVSVARLSERARIVVVPLGPKILSALAINVALEIGPQVGVWTATAGRGIEPVDVHGSETPVVARLHFRNSDRS